MMLSVLKTVKRGKGNLRGRIPRSGNEGGFGGGGGAPENRFGEAALFLVLTIYTSIRNNDCCHRTEQCGELPDARTPRGL